MKPIVKFIVITMTVLILYKIFGKPSLCNSEKEHYSNLSADSEYCKAIKYNLDQYGSKILVGMIPLGNEIHDVVTKINDHYGESYSLKEAAVSCELEFPHSAYVEKTFGQE